MENKLPWLEEATKKYNIDNKKLIGIGIVILIIGVIIFSLITTFSSGTTTKVEHNDEPKEASQIQVHVAGAVAKPGVYKLAQGSRIMDAINAAGGFTSEANQTSLNLAKTVEDGEQILIETNTAQTPQTSNDNGKVNINTADLSQLQTLSGVGPATAQKIIDYRSANGKFKSIEDLKKVSGIGDKTYEKFKDKICV
ncbi:MAG: ComEA family DNA-binding protein [Coriobacteriia bacterium]|nr:ComEA family DNA-binding protein [Coriobacteriia bacterium]